MMTIELVPMLNQGCMAFAELAGNKENDFQENRNIIKMIYQPKCTATSINEFSSKPLRKNTHLYINN